ncbi:putative RING finger protein [Corchorus capsularis]|uniref:Putative RING finger protein n=1 Tax=Corchorus capsularis TaxID=210143 RepID=A0A1R3IWF1_COCAP|nr:putative RING finger protein [Corchorus capsularis]
MSTLELRSGSSHRGYRRKKNLLDLNVPPSEIREQEGTSQQAGPEQLTSQPVRLEPRVTIDVEDIDDDVESIEPREFDEAVKNNSKRTHGRHARSAINNQNKRRRGPSKPTVINCDEYINLESSPQSIVRAVLLVLHSTDVF